MVRPESAPLLLTVGEERVEVLVELTPVLLDRPGELGVARHPLAGADGDRRPGHVDLAQHGARLLPHQAEVALAAALVITGVTTLLFAPMKAAQKGRGADPSNRDAAAPGAPTAIAPDVAIATLLLEGERHTGGIILNCHAIS